MRECEFVLDISRGRITRLEMQAVLKAVDQTPAPLSNESG